MLMQTQLIERADRFTRKRAFMFLVNALFFGAISLLLWPRIATPNGSATLFVWIAYAFIILLLVITGGALLLDRRVRQLMNDDLTKTNRRRAVQAGFYTMIVVAAAALAMPGTPFTGHAVAYCVLVAGLFVSLLFWALLELRSSQDA
jgi:protein-S-isoprenylcysteine O-methyltransferase Ste14